MYTLYVICSVILSIMAAGWTALVIWDAFETRNRLREQGGRVLLIPHRPAPRGWAVAETDVERTDA